MLTRMRQIALHPGLVPARYLEDLIAQKTSEGPISKPIVLTPVDKARLRGLLSQAIEDSEECPICLGNLPDDARITSCAHMFCLAWCAYIRTLAPPSDDVLQYYGSNHTRS